MSNEQNPSPAPGASSRRPFDTIIAVVLTLVCVTFVGIIAAEMRGVRQSIRCSRARGTCEARGQTYPLPEITGAALERVHHHNRGDYFAVAVVMRDQRVERLSSYDAQGADSVAEYQAAVNTLSAFIANNAQDSVEVNFTFRPNVRGMLSLVGGAVFSLIGAVVAWKRRRTTTGTVSTI